VQVDGFGEIDEVTQRIFDAWSARDTSGSDNPAGQGDQGSTRSLL
jgi:hypothetical protein